MVVRHRRLALDYSGDISYRLGFFLLLKFGGVYSVRIHDGLWAEDRKQILFHKDEATDVLYICSAIWPFALVDNK